MKKLLLCFSVLTTTLPVQISSAQNMIDKTGWDLKWSDEFNGSTIDLTKWDIGYHTRGRFTRLNTTNNISVVDPSNITVNNGYANLWVEKLNDSTSLLFDKCDLSTTTVKYTSSSLISRFDDGSFSGCLNQDRVCPNPNTPLENLPGVMYGMFEIRCKMPKGVSFFDRRMAAFWLSGWNEFDVFEYMGDNSRGADARSQILSNVHWFRDTESCQKLHMTRLPSDLSDDYHVYTFVWTPTALSWFFDGREIRTDNQPDGRIGGDCHWKSLLYLDAEVWNGMEPIDSKSASSPFSIDYVRVYKPTNGNYPTSVSSTPYAAPYTSTSYMGGQSLNSFYPLSSVGDAQINVSNTGCSSPCVVGPASPIATDGGKVFYRKANTNQLYNLGYYSGQWVPYPLIGPANVYSNIACSKSGTNVFYTDNNGEMYNFWYSGGWQYAGINTLANAKVGNNVISSAVNGDLYYRTVNNDIAALWFNGQWNNLLIYPNANVSNSEGAMVTKGNYIYYKRNDGVLCYTHASVTGSGGQWTNAVPINVASNVRGAIAIEGDDPANPRIFYIGTDNLVYNAYKENGNWVSYALNWRANIAESSLVVFGPNVYFKGIDNRIWNHYFYAGEWRLQPMDYDGTTGVTAGPIVGGDGRIFYANSNGYVFNGVTGSSRFTSNPNCGNYNSPISVSNRVVSTKTSDQANDLLGKSDVEKTKAKSAGVAYKLLIFNTFGQQVIGSSNPADFGDIASFTNKLKPGLYFLKFYNISDLCIKQEKMIVQ